jgi:hypothetical protein
MKISYLVPLPSHHETFNRSRERFIPHAPGCYALATFSHEILYIGLTHNLRRRINEHLDNPQKTGETKFGRAVLFFWLENDEINKVERTWLNIHAVAEGAWPVLNRVYSPTST